MPKKQRVPDAISQCISCKHCVKGGYGEDYFCRARGVHIKFDSKVMDCELFEDGNTDDIPVKYWRGRRV